MAPAWMGAMLVCALALAGCLGTPAATPGAPAAAAAPPAALFLSGAMALEPGAPAAGEAARVPLAWAWREWLAGDAPPTWTAAPADGAMLVHNASVTFAYAARAPALSPQQRPELTAWWGVDGAWVHHAFLDGPPLLLPGEVHEATIPLEVPVGGLAVPAGARLMLALATYYTDAREAAAIDLLLGSAERATRLDLAATRAALPALREVPLLEEQGAMEGGACMGLDAASPDTVHTFALELPAEAQGLRVALQRTGGQGPGDLDFALSGPGGERAARGQGPGPDEHVTLRAANLDAAGRGPWTLQVYNCTPQLSEYRVQAWLLLA